MRNTPRTVAVTTRARVKAMVLLVGLGFGMVAQAAPNPAKPPFTPSIERLDPAFDALVALDARLEKLADGFTWSEGPVWKEGALLFSDVPQNTMYRWRPGQTEAEVFMKPSGMLKPQPGFKEQGSNGLALDRNGLLLICQHGERRIARVEADGTQTAVVTHFEGKRFNSPNDLIQAKNGDIFFTDPPYGLEGGNASPLKELAFNGVYRVTPEGKVHLLVKDLTFPNGLGLSPDEKVLYVAVSDPKDCKIMAYGVDAAGALSEGRVFFNGQSLVDGGRKGLFDGLKVDARGNVFATGPGGVLVFSPEGKHLGTFLTGVPTGNCAWGGDGSVLYITADQTLCRVQTKTRFGSSFRP
jgi:gluconolactonase